MTEAELGYLAGIIDGEGSIYFNLNGSVCQPRVSVDNTHEGLIDYLHRLVPTSNTKASTENYASKKVGNKVAYRWGVSGKVDVKTLLELVLPYLVAKKDQAEIALQAIEVMPIRSDRFGKGRAYTDEELLPVALLINKLKALNKRGE